MLLWFPIGDGELGYLSISPVYVWVWLSIRVYHHFPIGYGECLTHYITLPSITHITFMPFTPREEEVGNSFSGCNEKCNDRIGVEICI